jgi:hypothetical protein
MISGTWYISAIRLEEARDRHYGRGVRRHLGSPEPATHKIQTLNRLRTNSVTLSHATQAATAAHMSTVRARNQSERTIKNSPLPLASLPVARMTYLVHSGSARARHYDGQDDVDGALWSRIR